VYAFVVVALGSRRVVHVGVTRHPIDAWVAQQLREATPFDHCPRSLIRGNDRKVGTTFARVAAASRSTVLLPPPRAPRANAVRERFLGSVRRECLDPLLILGERQFYRVLAEYVAYFNATRPHQGIKQATSASPRGTQRRGARPVRAIPILGGLQHDYRQAA
jgi:putative transposase